VEEAEALCKSVRCPILILHGTRDLCQPIDRARRLAEITDGALVEVEGAGHALMARHPVLVNLLIKEFVDGIRPPTPVTRTVTVGPSSGKRVLFLSSPIGLGHARRDLAVADALRELRPEVTVEWMTQHPVTAALGARGERVHPACDWLANESQHVESEAGEHDVHVFQALRSMDEILVANFMVFRDVLESEQYDLVVGDEAWDVDHFLHEHPQLKRAPFVWMTDFVGFLPMPDGGEREAFLTADYNAEMIEHVEGHPRVRDRSIFVGDPDDIVPEGFGQGLPSIREWTQAHYDFAGYVTGYDPVETADREALRAELGYGPDECVCLVTVGGSGVGGHLLGKVIDAYPEASDLVPGLRMVVVTGPRLDPDSFKATDGLEIVGYVPGLHRHLAASDVAVVHGGLTTTMELVANKRPFLYFPIGHHFEENFHVRHRLDRYGAGRRMDYAKTDPSAIAEAISEEAGREVRYRDVETGGAARAAALIAEVL
jgi:predicted glycosyltransferase